MAGSPTPEYKRLRVLELGRSGKVTTAQIAERVGLSTNTVGKILERAGVKPKGRWDRLGKKRR